MFAQCHSHYYALSKEPGGNKKDPKTRFWASEPSQGAHDELQAQIHQHLKAHSKGIGPTGTQSMAVPPSLVMEAPAESTFLEASSCQCSGPVPTAAISLEPYSKSKSKDLSIPVLDKQAPLSESVSDRQVLSTQGQSPHRTGYLNSHQIAAGTRHVDFPLSL